MWIREYISYAKSLGLVSMQEVSEPCYYKISNGLVPLRKSLA